MNTETISRSPLHWPANRLRTPTHKRERAQFSTQDKKGTRKNLSVADATNRILSELGKYNRTGHSYRVKPDSIIISTNLKYKLDGLPYSGQREPEDPGAAVYFTLDGKPYCLPADKWDRVADNLAAIAAHIAANRGIERWGVGQSGDVYAGYAALPPASEPARQTCWEVLGIAPNATPTEIEKAYRAKAKVAHPDAGGSEEQMQALNTAKKQALTTI